MRNLRYKKISFCVAVAALTVSLACNGASTAHAQSSNDVTQAQYTLLTPLPQLGSCPSGSNCTSNCASGSICSIDVSQFISYAYKFALALAVVLAVFMITIGGFEYMLSGAMDTKSNAIKKIQDAVAGLLLALASYLILYTIDPNLVSSSNLTIPPISATQGQVTTSP